MSVSITNQLKHAVSTCECFGQSRYRDKCSADDSAWKIYSVGETTDLIKLSVDLGGFLRTTFPEVRRVTDIRATHVQAWLDSKVESCAQTTLAVDVARCHKLESVCSHAYKDVRMQTDRLQTPISLKQAAPVKTQTMSASARDLLVSEMRSHRGEAWKSPVLADALGLRVRETANLHIDCFHGTGGAYGYGYVDIRSGSVDGSKHGRPRHIDIISAERAEEVRQCMIGVQPGETVIRNGGRPYKPESLDRAISRAMDKINASGTEVFGSEWKYNRDHSLRKAFAQACYDLRRRETAGVMSEQESKREAIIFVNRQLGHGDTRTDSIRAYVGAMW